jgi:DNA ligase D
VPAPEPLTLGLDNGETVSALWLAPPTAKAALALAHGAGAGMMHHGMEAVAAGLAARDIATLRYNFPYMEAGGKRPDPPVRAHRAVRAAAAALVARAPGLPCFAGGRSFGARMTSQAQALAPLPGVAGLVFFAFPLHPAGKPATERADHLAAVTLPMLFLQGTSDALAELALLQGVVNALGARAAVVTAADADHSFHVPARTGRKDADVLATLLDAAAAWMASTPERPSGAGIASPARWALDWRSAMSDLTRYRAKRRFGVTAEPSGKAAAPASDGPIFVVQKHHARRLHYDFRLEIGGALRSWAVPEGPCLDSKVCRLAVQTEDHPLDYAGFEGRIPGGEYGGGVVIVWDRGTWVTLADDPNTALAAGELKIRLTGEKLRGGWTLVRINKDPKNWLLIKERDDEVRAIAEYDVLEAAPRSVLSGKTVEELARETEVAAPARPKPARRIAAARVSGARLAPMPKLVAPQLATAGDAPPEGAEWLHEIKFDGYRTICRIEDGDVRLFTRNKHDWTHRYGPLADAFKALKCTSALIDGEVTVQDARGATSIALLEAALSEGRTGALTFFAFDLLYLDGYDLTAAKLMDRKAALAGLITPVIDAQSQIQLSEHVQGDGAALFAQACRLGLEGIVSKRRDAPYVQKRSKTWLKIKRAYVGDFIVVGLMCNEPKRIASFLLAEQDSAGDLVYVGRVTCPTEALSREWLKTLSALPPQPAMAGAPRMANAVWTEPAATARVAFNSRADDGAPRQPVLVSLSPYQKRTPTTKPRLVTDRDLAAIRLTNPEREMFEGSGVTKLDIALYYARVGDWMLPGLLRRPLSIIRCPSGRIEDCFYQRHAFHGLPPGVSTIHLSDEEGRADYIYVESAAGFLGLTQFGAIEFHPWPCTVDAPEEPDCLILDLDPDPALQWRQVCAAAETLGARLRDLGFAPFVRTTGGKGLHIVMAIAPGCDWPLLKTFAEAFATSAAKDAPSLFTASPNKERRKNRIFIDWLRNARGSSAVASYSLRARPAFPVAAPIAWSELREIASPAAFDRKSMVKRVGLLAEDPWDGLELSHAAITARARREVGMDP